MPRKPARLPKPTRREYIIVTIVVVGVVLAALLIDYLVPS